jgi:hypothetical protein
MYLAVHASYHTGRKKYEKVNMASLAAAAAMLPLLVPG